MIIRKVGVPWLHKVKKTFALKQLDAPTHLWEVLWIQTPQYCKSDLVKFRDFDLKKQN